MGSQLGGVQRRPLQGHAICLNDGQDLNDEKRQSCEDLGETEATTSAKVLRQE